MKASELMVGDLVLTPCTPTKVKQVRENCILGSDGHRGLIDESELEPILLTEAILKKNGFVFTEGEKCVGGVVTVPYYSRDDVPFEVFCDGEPFAIWFKYPVNIKYAHQLQHALRLCGITKEIEL